MRRRSVLGVLTATVFVFSAAACSDSSGPGSVDADGALKSLSLLGDVSNNGGATFESAGFLGLGSLLDQVDVQIAGKTHTMYALGLRETFPAGTCEENIFIVPGVPPTPGECTTPDLGLAVILWQSHSANAPPDRILFLGSNVGSGDFSFASDLNITQIPAFAFYAEGQEKLWASVSGTISSQITPTSQSCALPLPPYAVSATCNIANFDEQANIVLEDFSALTSTGPSINIVIPRQTLRGVLQNITQVKPITITP
ncbi:MAG TPA: hypothetical protein VM166_14905 [Gemmatimonadaceae bacterium]|nr:hypothetical protein [Gemmatimonadaceae bacterium]